MEEELRVPALQGLEEATLKPVELLPCLLMTGLVGKKLLLVNQASTSGKKNNVMSYLVAK